MESVWWLPGVPVIFTCWHLTTKQTLKLEENRISHIRSLSATNLPSLESLSLDFNPIDTFTLFDSRNAAIESLSLQHCNISDAASVPFSCIDRLRFLKLSYNRIRHIDVNSFPKSVNTSNYESFTRRDLIPSKCNAGNETKAGILLVIDISHNYIDAINNAFHGLQLLEQLDIDYNQLEHVPDDAFKTNINLKQLNMGSNKISWIGKLAFTGLGSLVELKLTSNRLTTLNGSLYFMPRLRSLYLRDNQLLSLRENDFGRLPRLGLLYAERNNISDVRGAFKTIASLEHLCLHGNHLTVIHRASLPEDITKLKKITIEGNPLTCDCQLSWLYEVPQLYMDYDVPVCNSPPRLAGAPFLSNETRYSLDIWLEDCDEKCTCKCMTKGYEGFIKVDCSHRNMEAVPRKFPEDTAVVDLSGNLLDTLDTSLAEEAPAVRSLNLSNNLYTALDWKALPTNLSYLSLQNNSFKHFPLSIVDNLNLSGIWLSGNPWDCDCEDYAFRQWAESHEDTIRDAHDVRCVEGANTQLSSRLFMDLEQKDLCPFKTSGFVTYGVPLLVIIPVSLALATIYLKRKKQIKIWLYAHGVRWVKEDDLDKDKTFDVFLSFSSKDSDWAYAHLLPGLEESGFSVCTYDRNFKGGFLLQDIIQEAVACSRRTLLLLTQNFVESEWCRWEFRVAHRTSLQDKLNRLIIVVPENVPEDIDSDLALYMKTTNYLSWREKHFWDKLRYSLPKKDIERDTTPVPGAMRLSTIYKNHAQR
ncbi:protein toll-like isoform X2 [Ornithodoros turicata]|uniref:protein toll-like isoform X2 n=1 Tax=Ornithodoros turicata TaxID=34597 RepID=UPI003138F4A6